ncbi:hypothetical protein M5X17_24010 [Paenibacillus alvei]|uniref:Uncharacterized protein n=4 Tax=Paenibacillus alvei TaxID=44250 RepID=A0ABT4H6X9_PAEAL|nr:hypothetical protein [Paenibacillus alvei]MCY9704058.1 hypothetical protein [Paenibacillus alvei]MCY9736786.1 hypothetical protein [Paenibacillus alvei]MCY9764719.1 hypothetical protein [Paenibacillus alvei]MCY9765414.1 hypothetical protein [Paenibacillus alvei]MEC0079175.1 hypothetical protein [Paenibacillus alvei]
MIKAVKGKLLIFVMIMVSFLLMISSTVNASFIEKEFLSKEDFERGRYADTKFTAGAGIITNEADKVVNGNYSAYLYSPPTREWSEFTYTDTQQVQFEKNTTYAVTFSYKAVEAPNQENNGLYYFLARSTDNEASADTGWTTWNAKTGEKGTKTFVFTTGSKDNYYLIWGIHCGGGLSIDDIHVKKVNESFEQGTYKGTFFQAVSGSITNDPAKVVNGNYSAYLTSSKEQEWSEFAYTDTDLVKFEKNTAYEVTFSYKAIEAPDKFNTGAYYFLARSTDNDVAADAGWTAWNPRTGEKGTKTFTFTTGNKNNYYLIWGIRRGGALSIDDIYIKKKAESFEKGTFEGTFFRAGSGTITNDPDKVISGNYSAYLSSPRLATWAEFAYTEPSLIRFDKNTTYSVTFSYKAIEAPHGYYYFLARSTDNDVAADTGWTTWSGQKGETSRKTVVFTTGEKENYYLIWGIQNGGAISIDDIRIDLAPYQYDQNGRLLKQATPTKSIQYFYDSNGNVLRRRADINYY